jgi:L-asparaginase/Glu-tRNA(Gln) amidotransferase subunit D
MYNRTQRKVCRLAVLAALVSAGQIQAITDTMTSNIVVGTGGTIGSTTGSAGGTDTYNFSNRDLDMAT